MARFTTTTDDFEKAIDDFTEAIKLDANAFDYHNRGLAYSRIGDFDNAVNDLHRGDKTTT